MPEVRVAQGALVVDEVIFPIRRLYLSGGKMHVVTEALPVESTPWAGGKVQARIHDPDGGLVFLSEVETTSLVGTYPGDLVRVDFMLNCVWADA